MECYLQNNLESTVSFKEKKNSKKSWSCIDKIMQVWIRILKNAYNIQKISRISSNISDDFLKRIVRSALCPYKEGQGNEHGLKRRGWCMAPELLILF